MIKLENFNDDDGHSGEDHIVRPESAVGRFCEETSERRLETLQREIALVIITCDSFLQLETFSQDPVSKPWWK